MTRSEGLSMNNVWRLCAFDVAAPLAMIGGLLAIGVVLAWPLWWVSACSILVLLVVEGIALNFYRRRHGAMTIGTDDARPALRLGVVALGTAALVAAVVVGYTHWTIPDRNLKDGATEAVKVASEVMEATATVSPESPTASIDKAAALVAPDHKQAFVDKFAKTAAELASHNVTAEATTVAAGVEAINQSAARVAVLLHRTQNVWDQPPKSNLVAARVLLEKKSGRWLVIDVAPLHGR
jgi:hypothetical protein